MRSYKISYFRKDIGNVEYIETFSNKRAAKTTVLSRMCIIFTRLGVKKKLKNIGVKGFKIKKVRAI